MYSEVCRSIGRRGRIKRGYPLERRRCSLGSLAGRAPSSGWIRFGTKDQSHWGLGAMEGISGHGCQLPLRALRTRRWGIWNWRSLEGRQGEGRGWWTRAGRMSQSVWLLLDAHLAIMSAWCWWTWEPLVCCLDTKMLPWEDFLAHVTQLPRNDLDTVLTIHFIVPIYPDNPRWAWRLQAKRSVRSRRQVDSPIPSVVSWI